ncbi:MAG: amino acid-binding protein [Rhodospirillales bacterium]|jgi:glycine cleavage system transcriptional repressor
MSHIALVSVFCPDRTGLIAAIAGRMFDLGANLGDTTFAVLGSGAEFTSITELPDAIENETLAAELASVPELAEAKITVTDFELDPIQDQAGKITHRITVRGGDQPGLIARLSELFIEYKANIVRLSSEKTPDGNYILRISVSIPEGSAESCLATVANTAEGLQLSCDVETP